MRDRERPGPSENQATFEVALHSFLAREEYARACGYLKKRIDVLMTSLKRGSLSDLKTHIRRVPDGEFF